MQPVRIDRVQVSGGGWIFTQDFLIGGSLLYHVQDGLQILLILFQGCHITGADTGFNRGIFRAFRKLIGSEIVDLGKPVPVHNGRTIRVGNLILFRLECCFDLFGIRRAC